MITSLSIINYALIEKLSVDFSSGFSIITGETGAGKSIVLGALGLVLGKRADLTSLKNKDSKCIIEAHFDVSKYNLQSFFESKDLDYDNLTIIRREILPSGKSRAFINDSPVNLQELQELSVFLLDIHSQHQTHELSEEKMQFEIIDVIANARQEIANYQSLLKKYKKDKASLSLMIKSKLDADRDKDYNSFLLNELLAAKLKSGEQELLEADFEKLNNVETIREALNKSLSIAFNEQIGLRVHCNEVKSSLQKITNFSVDYRLLADRFTSLNIELDDIIGELSRHSDILTSDPDQLALLNQKLQLIYSLQKKHQVSTVDDLLIIQYKLEGLMQAVESISDEIEKLNASLLQTESDLDFLAKSIHDKRVGAVPVLSEKLIVILESLGMPNVQFKIELDHSDSYFDNGKDQLQFLFSANKGADFGALKKVASGGEMSRIMLAVKAILSHYNKLPTLIFDEIDTGVSGEIANKMGLIMQEMSRNMQIFAITHLPQIAAKGSVHFKVSKSTIGNDTQSELRMLSQDERLIEIAQMLSGNLVSDSALNHARTLLN